MGIGPVERQFECRRAHGFLLITSEADGAFGEHIGDGNSKPCLMHQSGNIDLRDFAVVQSALRLLHASRIQAITQGADDVQI